VPATSANLGPGFDSLGLALSLHDDLEAWLCPSGLSIEITGEGAGLAEAGEEHLVVRAMRAAFDVIGVQPPGIGLRCVNRIPHGRGLGSSAAAIVAGILAARVLAADGQGKLPDEAAFRLAAGLEGHPDNVAACLAGGLTVAWTAAGGPRLVRLEPLPWIRPVMCVAPSSVRTGVARGLLPDVVPHRDAALNAGRSALLVAALCLPEGSDPPQTPPAHGGTARPPVPPWPPDHGGIARPGGPPWPPDHGGTARPPVPHGPSGAMSVLLDATEDWLHHGYRASAMPETYALLRRLRGAGLPAVVSGAGPSVLVLLGAREGDDHRHHLDSLGSIVKETGTAWHISPLDVERQGARVLRPESPSDC
jgi:homoserine kinase